MKNQGVWITKILSLALCVFVVLYMGYHLISAWDEPVRTTTAVLLSTSQAETVTGVVIRDEDVLSMPSVLTEMRVGESERVSAGQTMAVVYSSSSAMEDSRKLAQSMEQRELLEYMEYHSVGITETFSIDDQIRSRMSSLLSSVRAGSLGRLERDTLDLKTLLFRQNYAFGEKLSLRPLIERLDADIARLSGSVASASTVVKADKPGLFSAHTDGLEDVWTFDAVKDLTVGSFEALSARGAQAPAVGKARLVRSWTWQFACVMTAASAYRLGSTGTLLLDDGSTYTLEKTAVSPEENGMCAVTFQSSKYISSVLSRRKVRADVLFASYEGIRVPREGLRIDSEGQPYVYCLLLGQVVRKNVSLYNEIDRENYYLAVYDISRNNALLPGDEIIVSGRDLFDGRVLRK